MKKILLFAFCLLCVYSAFAQKKVISLPTDSTTILPSVHFKYVLPKTAFWVKVEVEKTHKIPGCYAEFAEKLLGLNEVVKKEEYSYSIKNIIIQDFVVPDNSLQFVVELSSNKKNKDLLNTLYNLKKSPDDYYYTTFFDSSEAHLPDFFRYYSQVKYQEMQESYIDTRIVDGTIVQIPVNQTKTVSKSLLQQAQEAADFIAKIREDRYAVLSAKQEVAYSSEALEYMILSLNELETNYIELFSGTQLKKTTSYSIIVVPDDENDLLIPLFSFTTERGFTEPIESQKTGNYYLRISPQVDMTSLNTLMNQTENNPKFKPNNGYRIRHAVPAYLSLIQDNNEFLQLGTFYLYQLGKLDVLPLKNDNFNIFNWAFIY